MQDPRTRTRDCDDAVPTKPTLFHQVLDSKKLPPEDKTVGRLAEEVRSAIGAGTETTSNALTVTTFHLLENPEKLQRLRDELQNLEPDQNVEFKLTDLEQLPYLVSTAPYEMSHRANVCPKSSVIQEGLR